MYINQITTPEDYLDMVWNLTFLIDDAFRPIERMLDGAELDIDFMLNRIPALVSLVNTLWYIAGRESMFSDVRPKGGNSDAATPRGGWRISVCKLLL